MRAFLLPGLGLVFTLLFLAPYVRGDGKPVPAGKIVADAPENKPVPADLPLTRVVLFNAGIGYFHREGDVTGDAKLDLSFDEADVNDLLKTLVLTDRDGGKTRAVTYDNRLPVEMTLKGFAVDVTENPTIGQLIHQVRGEKVEVTDRGGVVVSGQVVSVEHPTPTTAIPNPSELLNLLTEDGLQTVELKQLKKIKFVRPELQAEFRKALDLLAKSRGDNKKTVSVVFSGKGKRRVAVGYVTEAPLWKPSYRLIVDEKGEARLQGWATVENTTEEDWKDVKVALVAGRPMAFQMDMYDPLFVPRPRVEPELYASLRPPMYQGGLNPGQPGAQLQGMMGMGGGMMGMTGMAGIQGGQGFQVGGGMQGQGLQGNFQGQLNLGVGGGQLGIGGAQQMGGQFGFQGGFGYSPYPPRSPRPSLRNLYSERLNFQAYLERLHGKTPEDQPATIRDPLDRQGGALAAADRNLGEMFEYAIEERISLPRQKSAMLPFVNEPVQGARVSIYNATVLANHPLLGLKLANKTKLPLAQGPVAVFDGGTYAGDARLPDLKPNEMRLLSYAIDLGTEVVVRNEPVTSVVTGVTVSFDSLEIYSRYGFTTRYLVRNRNIQDRTVVLEHPRYLDRKLVAPPKPTDETRSFYRFEEKVKAGNLVTLEVAEESTGNEIVRLSTGNINSMVFFLNHEATKPAVREVLKKVIEFRQKIAAVQREIRDEQAALKGIADEQDRIRKNLERTPKESDTFKRYLKKFDDQESEIERRQARLKQLNTEEEKASAALRAYVETTQAK